jgi:hypothetical protein
MQQHCGRMLFISSIIATATFVGMVLELELPGVSFDRACRTLLIASAMAACSYYCGVAHDWFRR